MPENTAELEQATNLEEGSQTATPAEKVAIVPAVSFATQKEYDDEAARIRKVTERQAEAAMLKLLGLNPEDRDKLPKVAEAYNNSLTNEEKISNDLVSLRGDVVTLTAELEEREYIIAALCKLTGRDIKEVEKIVKMAKGLKDADTTIDGAIEAVMTMLKPAEPSTTPTQMPRGTALLQPDPPMATDVNPFKAGEHFNVTEQGKLYRADPDKARRMAKEAGVPINY